MSKRIAPKNASEAELNLMHRDHTEYGDFCLMVDGNTVWLSEQAVYKAPTQGFKIPKWKFNRLLRWYLREVAVRGRERRKK